MNHPARSCTPLIGHWLDACGKPRSSVALASIRYGTYPSKSSLDQVVYHKRLFRRAIAESIVEIINNCKSSTASNDDICDFEFHIPGFGAAVNTVCHQRGRSEVLEQIAIGAGYDAVVVAEMLKRKTLVPKAVCDAVLMSARSIPNLRVDNLKIVRANLNGLDQSPLALDCGRYSIFDKLYPGWNA